MHAVWRGALYKGSAIVNMGWNHVMSFFLWTTHSLLNVMSTYRKKIYTYITHLRATFPVQVTQCASFVTCIVYSCAIYFMISFSHWFLCIPRVAPRTVEVWKWISNGSHILYWTYNYSTMLLPMQFGFLYISRNRQEEFLENMII